MDFRVEDVTREAGLAKGTFYLYFESREALTEALRERLALDAIDVIMTAAEGPWDGLWTRIIERSAEWMRSLGNVSQVFAPSRRDRPERMVMLQGIREIVAIGCAQKVLRLPETYPAQGASDADRLDVASTIVQACLVDTSALVALGKPVAATAAADGLLRQLFRQNSRGLAFDRHALIRR